MTRQTVTLGLLLAATTLMAAVQPTEVFYVYHQKADRANHYIPSGWMGDYGDLRLDDGNKDKPLLKDTTTSIKWTYSGEAKQGANWAGCFWQHPANNWGDKPGGFDLTGYKKLTFWARGAKGGEQIAEFKVGGITGEFGDSDGASIGPVVLTKEWKEYSIELKGLNLSHIIGGFCWSTSRDANPEGLVMYLSNIQFVKA